MLTGGREVRVSASRISSRPPVLTARQWQLLRLRALGHTNITAAIQMGIAEQSAKNTSDDIYRRLRVNNLADALRAVGWLVVPEENEA